MVNLLIVDDEDLLVKSVKYLLSEFVDNIFTARNGEEGLKIFDQEAIQCIVSDIAMPKMTGIELLKSIRDKGSKVPFIFYTSFGHEELMIEAAQLGAVNFLKKPDFDKLQAAVIKVLNHEPPFDQHEILNEYPCILQKYEIKK